MSSPLTEETLDFLESHVPALGEAATRAAFVATLAAGQSTLIAVDGALYEIFPDGSRRFVKELPPLVKVEIRDTSDESL
jgi:hypothetical protein